MKLEGVVYCEGPECEVWSHVGVPNMDAGRLPVGWVRVIEYGDAGTHETGYCGWDCVLKRAAQTEPPTIIRWQDALGTDEPSGGSPS